VKALAIYCELSVQKFYLDSFILTFLLYDV